MTKHIHAIAGRLMAFAVDVTPSAGGGGSGGDGSATASTTADPHLAYVANYHDNPVSTYPVDATNGRLKLTGKVARRGPAPHPLPLPAPGSKSEPLQSCQARRSPD